MGRGAKMDERYTVNEFQCGCLIRSEFTNGMGCKWILYCPMHKAAPKMLETLKAAGDAINDELQAAGVDEVKQQPTLKRHAIVLEQVRAAIKMAA